MSGEGQPADPIAGEQRDQQSIINEDSSKDEKSMDQYVYNPQDTLGVPCVKNKDCAKSSWCCSGGKCVPGSTCF